MTVKQFTNQNHYPHNMFAYVILLVECRNKMIEILVQLVSNFSVKSTINLILHVRQSCYTGDETNKFTKCSKLKCEITLPMHLEIKSISQVRMSFVCMNQFQESILQLWYPFEQKWQALFRSMLHQNSELEFAESSQTNSPKVKIIILLWFVLCMQATGLMNIAEYTPIHILWDISVLHYVRLLVTRYDTW